jgi:hypothetical protein
MSTTAHLWAIGYDDMGRADQVKDESNCLAGLFTGCTLIQPNRIAENPRDFAACTEQPLVNWSRT